MMEAARKRNPLKDLLMSIFLIAVSVLAVLFLPFESLTAEAREINLESYFDKDEVMEVDISIDEAVFQDMIDNASDEEYKDADITVNGDVYGGVKIRTKGNSSLSSVSRSGGERYSFKVEFGDNLQLNLNNMFSDPSYMREYLSYEIMEKFGMPVPLFSYAKVSINGEYFGLYFAVESILETYLERNFEDASGDLYKSDGNTLAYSGDEEDSYTGLEIKTNEEDYDFRKVTDLLKAIAAGEDLEEHLDVDSALRYLAVNTALMNFDSYLGNFGHNYYLYEVDGRFTILPWDFNMSFGGFNMGISSASSIYIDEPVQGSLSSRPLVKVLVENEEYLETYHTYLSEIARSYLTEEYLEKRIGELDDLIGELVMTDPTAFYEYGEYLENISAVTDEDLEGIEADEPVMGSQAPSGNVPEARSKAIKDMPGQGSPKKLMLIAHLMAENIELQLSGEKPSSNGGNGSSAGMQGGLRNVPDERAMRDGIRMEKPVAAQDKNYDSLIAAGFAAFMAVFLALLIVRKRRRFHRII